MLVLSRLHSLMYAFFSQDNSHASVNLEPVKFSLEEAVDSTALTNSMDTNSVSSEDFYDAEEGPIDGTCSSIVDMPDRDGSSTDCKCKHIFKADHLLSCPHNTDIVLCVFIPSG